MKHTGYGSCWIGLHKVGLRDCTCTREGGGGTTHMTSQEERERDREREGSEFFKITKKTFKRN
jgi:hypothetical protein